MKNRGLVIVCIASFGLLIAYYFQNKELAAYRVADAAAVANRAHWDSIRINVPEEGYAGFLKAEEDRKQAFTAYWIKGNAVHYWSSNMPSFYICVKYKKYDSWLDKTIIELDSTDIAYFHRKSVSRLEMERKKAINDVNEKFDAVKKGTEWTINPLKINP